MFFASLILLLFSVFLFIKTKEKVNNNDVLKKKEKEIWEAIEIKKAEKDSLNREIDEIKTKIQEQKFSLNNQKELLGESFSQYIELLEWKYKEKENDYDNAIDSMRYSYGQKQKELMAEIGNIENDLSKIQATRAAAQEALLKEKEIKEQLDFYCIKLTPEEIEDINILERIKSKLHQPRILCMLIWSTYFQKPMTNLCNNILGINKICGIYKITNQKTNECYIGQAVDVSTRWKNHAKYGLGIDTPLNNKLYKAMQEDGLWNFSWELLEKCSKEELNEKEEFYIKLYQSKEYGYNSVAAPKKR